MSHPDPTHDPLDRLERLQRELDKLYMLVDALKNVLDIVVERVNAAGIPAYKRPEKPQKPT